MAQSLATGVYTPEAYAEALRRVGPQINLSILAGLRKGMASAKGTAVAYFRRQGIGRRVFGLKPSGAFKLIQAGKPAQFGDTFVATLRAKGLAAIQDAGLRIRPHMIAPKNAKALVYRTKNGVLRVSTVPVQHPGATHPKMPFLQPAVERASPRIREEIDRAIQAALVRQGVA